MKYLYVDICVKCYLAKTNSVKSCEIDAHWFFILLLLLLLLLLLFAMQKNANSKKRKKKKQETITVGNDNLILSYTIHGCLGAVLCWMLCSLSLPLHVIQFGYCMFFPLCNLFQSILFSRQCSRQIPFGVWQFIYSFLYLLMTSGRIVWNEQGNIIIVIHTSIRYTMSNVPYL